MKAKEEIKLPSAEEWEKFEKYANKIKLVKKIAAFVNGKSVKS